jgi:hypothetical protein
MKAEDAQESFGTEPQADYDSPWKDMLEHYFSEFIGFFFPEAGQGIDWSKPYEFLDKELQQVVRDAALGRRLVDKLVKVWRTNGEEAWVLVHVEVQGQEEKDFEKRMYVYNYRLFDRYDRKVATLVVLADDRAGWRPACFEYELFGCEVRMKFPHVKLLDYEKQYRQLEKNRNPFAIVVMAYLKARETARKPEIRLRWKVRLFKMLYEKGYSGEDILELIRFLDWIMVLPQNLEQRFDETIHEYEEGKTMRYVTSFERNATARGLQQGLQEGLQEGLHQGFLLRSREDIIEILEARFAHVPPSMAATISAIEELAVLNKLLKKAATAGSVQEFQEELH